jgi:hypothetical protein
MGGAGADNFRYKRSLFNIENLLCHVILIDWKNVLLLLSECKKIEFKKKIKEDIYAEHIWAKACSKYINIF